MASPMKSAWLMAMSKRISGYSARNWESTSSTRSATRTVLAPESLKSNKPTASLPL